MSFATLRESFIEITHIDFDQDFNKKIETVDLETLMEYFKEVTEYISENQFFHINPEKSDEYKSAYLKARSDLSEGWFNPNDYNRKSLINHLLSCDAYSIEYLEGYCDGAFA